MKNVNVANYVRAESDVAIKKLVALWVWEHGFTYGLRRRSINRG